MTRLGSLFDHRKIGPNRERMSFVTPPTKRRESTSTIDRELKHDLLHVEMSQTLFPISGSVHSYPVSIDGEKETESSPHAKGRKNLGARRWDNEDIRVETRESFFGRVDKHVVLLLLPYKIDTHIMIS